MAWTIEIGDKASRELKKLGHPDAQRILRFLSERLYGLNEQVSQPGAL